MGHRRVLVQRKLAHVEPSLIGRAASRLVCSRLAASPTTGCPDCAPASGKAVRAPRQSSNASPRGRPLLAGSPGRTLIVEQRHVLLVWDWERKGGDVGDWMRCLVRPRFLAPLVPGPSRVSAQSPSFIIVSAAANPRPGSAIPRPWGARGARRLSHGSGVGRPAGGKVTGQTMDHTSGYRGRFGAQGHPDGRGASAVRFGVFPSRPHLEQDRGQRRSACKRGNSTVRDGHRAATVRMRTFAI